jgi:hypothetical protein
VPVEPQKPARSDAAIQMRKIPTVRNVVIYINGSTHKAPAFAGALLLLTCR